MEFSLWFFRYIHNLIEVYYLKLFAGPFLFTFSISLSIFAQLIVNTISFLGLHIACLLKMLLFIFLKLNFPAGYACAICCYVQLMIMCYTGNSVKMAVKMENAIFFFKVY